MVGGSNIFSANDPAPHFNTTYGLHRRVAYVHSSPIVMPDQDDFLKLTVTKGVRTAQGGAQTRDAIEEKLRIPRSRRCFRSIPFKQRSRAIRMVSRSNSSFYDYRRH